ncbi:hypothetical protein SELMODRAFT_403815 [Selaginella moellendorffii]|uniref:G-protein coupled receptors family 1 profile domain-containing protein n=1 Tax=Selaginella moellendorffii TaxID=88036 RepID=D8QSM1_SELML|nr:hypothetical protein SELMODRAFT_403815 [Selaginella moellendorffii]
MPLSSEEALQIVTLVLLVCLSGLGVACIAYVFSFRRKIIHGRGFNVRHLREFNSPWLLRVLLSSLGALWLLLELLRLPILRNRGWAFHGLDFQEQANVCRSYVLLTLGFAEPGFFLAALFLIRQSLRSDPFSFMGRRRWRHRSVVFIALLALPAVLVQLFLVFIVPAIEYSSFPSFAEQDEGFRGAIPKSFTMAFVNETRTRTTSSSGGDGGGSTTTITTTRFVAACRVPLLSTVATSIFSVCYVAYFLFLGWKMVLLVINRRLQIRVYGLLTVVMVLVPLHVLLLGLSSSALAEHRSGKHEVVAFLRFLVTACCVSVGEWMLVVRPIKDAIGVLEAALRRGGSMKVVGRLNSWGAIPVDQLSLSVDEDNRSLITEISVELTPLGMAGAAVAPPKNEDDEDEEAAS